MIGMRVGVKNRIQPAEAHAQHLLAEIGRGVHYDIVPVVL